MKWVLRYRWSRVFELLSSGSAAGKSRLLSLSLVDAIWKLMFRGSRRKITMHVKGCDNFHAEKDKWNTSKWESNHLSKHSWKKPWPSVFFIWENKKKQSVFFFFCTFSPLNEKWSNSNISESWSSSWNHKLMHFTEQTERLKSFWKRALNNKRNWFSTLFDERLHHKHFLSSSGTQIKKTCLECQRKSSRLYPYANRLLPLGYWTWGQTLRPSLSSIAALIWRNYVIHLRITASSRFK